MGIMPEKIEATHIYCEGFVAELVPCGHKAIMPLREGGAIGKKLPDSFSVGPGLGFFLFFIVIDAILRFLTRRGGRRVPILQSVS